MLLKASALTALLLTILAVPLPGYEYWPTGMNLTATVSEAPYRIRLTWSNGYSTQPFRIARTPHAGGATVQLANPAATATTFDDTTALPGVRYEYTLKDSEGCTCWIDAGIRIPVADQRGTVVLLVDQTMATPLAPGLVRLAEDLVGDGWQVIRHDVPRFEVGEAGWKEAVVSTKALIAADYAAAPGSVKSVFLFGHVPVPYSGAMALDGHSDHWGAWPTDTYYGDMSGTWTDTTVNTTTASRVENRNVPGDGKFDQLENPHPPLTLAVGRVDMARMGAFGQTEATLLQRYLDKDHAHRWKQRVAARRGLYTDYIPSWDQASGPVWDAFSSLVGKANVLTNGGGTWASTLASNDYLCAGGSGYGWYSSAAGVCDTAGLASTTCRTMFTFLFGSYLGDWDSDNNVMRAVLAMPDWGLSCGFSHYCSLERMAAGDTIGAALQATQDRGDAACLALLGDPTLCAFSCAPASALGSTVAAGSVTLAWTASADVGSSSGEGYLVYRGSNRMGPFTRLTPSAITAATYTDSGVANGTWYYLVRAVMLETSATATYLNASQAAVATAVVGGSPVPEVAVSRGGAPVSDGGSDAVTGTVAGTGTALTYTIANTGSAALTLGATGAITGTNCTVAITTAAAASVAAGANTTLVLTITPTAAGAWSFPVSFATNDSNENPTNWTVSGTATAPSAPEIAVTRVTTTVADGGTDAVTGTMAGTGTTLTYTIANAGSAALTLGATGAITGTNCTIAITTAAAATVAAGANTALVLTVTPTAAGAWSFPVSFATNDSDENPTNWTVSGTATAPSTPEIAVTRSATAVADGSIDAVTGTVASTGTALTYTVANTGSAALTVGATGAITGTNCTIGITTPAAASVAAGANTTLVLTVTPTAAGAWSFPVSFATNDSDENPTNWTVSGSAGDNSGGETTSLGGTGDSGGCGAGLAGVLLAGLGMLCLRRQRRD